MNLRSIPIVVASALLLCGSLCAQEEMIPQAGWVSSVENDELRDRTLQVFTLESRPDRPLSPYGAGSENPALIAKCYGGKLQSAYLYVGAVVQPMLDGHASLKGHTQAGVDLRIDDRKPFNARWELDNSGQALFIDRTILNELLTGRLLGHPSDAAQLSHRVLIGVTLAYSSEYIIHFSMPRDASQMVLSCGLEWDRGRRKGLEQQQQLNAP